MEEKIYKIFKKNDENSVWYATDEGIEYYLQKIQKEIPDYNEENSWVDNLKSHGLEYEELIIVRGYYYCKRILGV